MLNIFPQICLIFFNSLQKNIYNVTVKTVLQGMFLHKLYIGTAHLQ